MTLLFGERSSGWILMVFLISLVGVALLSWGDISGGGDHIRGVFYALMTVATYAIYIVGVMKSRASKVDTTVLAFYVLSISALFFLIYSISTEGVAIVKGWHSWRNLLLLALLPTVLSNITLVLAIRDIGSTMTSILGSMEPLTALGIGVWRFDESFTIDSAAGALLVILAVVIVIIQSKTPKNESVTT